jgi:hypothetical protein
MLYIFLYLLIGLLIATTIMTIVQYVRLPEGTEDINLVFAAIFTWPLCIFLFLMGLLVATPFLLSQFMISHGIPYVKTNYKKIVTKMKKRK